MQEIINFLTSNKAEDIQTFFCKEYICENVIVATTLNPIHSRSLAENFLIHLKSHNMSCTIDGDSQDGWVAVEVSGKNTIIHLMTQPKRDYFRIEDIVSQLKKKV
ncbi:MAG: ribosomal silencing factor RsfS [Candidatus Deianiraeaceae bacterium]|jgi:ribosomal silencing factor RsfS